MPPKIKNTKEEILQAALQLVQEQGESGLNARSLAKAMNCSTQPIYFNFGSMEHLKDEVCKLAKDLYQEYVEREIAKEKYSDYKATQIAYLRFANKERNLFKLLFLSSDETSVAESAAELGAFAEMVHRETGISKTEALFFHLKMWSSVHGMATMIATNRLSWDGKLISRLLSDIFEGILMKYEIKEDDEA